MKIIVIILRYFALQMLFSIIMYKQVASSFTCNNGFVPNFVHEDGTIKPFVCVVTKLEEWIWDGKKHRDHAPSPPETYISYKVTAGGNWVCNGHYQHYHSTGALASTSPSSCVWEGPFHKGKEYDLRYL